MPAAHIREIIDNNSMEPFQVRTVAICLIGSILTGLSILSIPLTGPAIADFWQLDPEVLGALYSSTLAGMMLGAFVFGPFADIYGRRLILIICMIIMTLGLFYAAYSPDPTSLMIARLITGLGIGGSLTSYNSLTAEYTSVKRRDLCIGIIVSSGAISGIIGGVASAYLIEAYSWRAVFFAAGVLGVVIIPFILLWLPESVDYLLTKRKENTLGKINFLLKKMNHETIAALPEHHADAKNKQGFKTLLSKALFMKTILVWISCLMVFTGFYFSISWMPKLLVNAGWEMSQALYAMVILNVGGLFCGVVFGMIASRFSYRVAIAFILSGSFLAFILFGYFGSYQSLIYIMPLLLGLFVYGTITSQYALLPRLYESSIRNTGTGWALGVGKLAAISGPYIGGVLLSKGWESFTLFYAFSITYVCALLAVLGIWYLEKKQVSHG